MQILPDINSDSSFHWYWYWNCCFAHFCHKFDNVEFYTLFRKFFAWNILLSCLTLLTIMITIILDITTTTMMAILTIITKSEAHHPPLASPKEKSRQQCSFAKWDTMRPLCETYDRQIHGRDLNWARQEWRPHTIFRVGKCQLSNRQFHFHLYWIVNLHQLINLSAMNLKNSNSWN